MAESVHEQQHDNAEHDSLYAAMLKLQEYISNYDDGIILAGPPTLKGSLANFYKEHPSESALIKACEFEQNKTGIHSFVHKYKEAFILQGRAAQKHIVLAKNTTKQRKTSRSCDTSSEQVQMLSHRINELRGTIRSIEVLIKELSDQVEKLST